MSESTSFSPPLYHLVLDDVFWAYYEHTLEQIGDRRLYVTYCDGCIEIMSPVPEHEQPKRVIGRLIEALTLEAGIPMRAFGSTTFRREDRRGGLEPDECYYITNEQKSRGMKRFDPLRYPAPDLAVEIDVFSRSIAREPIYARLGVPELWRYSGLRVVVRLLQEDGLYVDSPTSALFPWLPMVELDRYVDRMLEEEQNSVVLDFGKWIRGLPR